MIEIKNTEVRTIVQEIIDSKKKWHFHILTPDCQLSTSPQFALIVESTVDDQIFVSYFDQNPMELGEELVKLLHGSDIIQGRFGNQEPSSSFQLILNKAKELNSRGIFWHHHMLFPDCIYNTSKGKWKIILEDKEANEVLESLSDNEPKSDLQQMELLFYQQKS
ncbi:MAG: hypothetical protein Q7K55_00110 [Candidatus Levybacteria bacterium]|nr:hypothetical protein [Candidatus Levybacteria bacterium]